MLINFFISILLCLNLTYLIVKSKLVVELSLFAKQKNMNKLLLNLFINNLVNLQFVKTNFNEFTNIEFFISCVNYCQSN